MTHRDQRLHDLAAEMGIEVEYGRLRRPCDGVWLPRRRVIRLLPGMHARQHRSVLAHELAHAIHGDVPSPFGPVHMRQEHRADEWAAQTLIEIDEYRRAETICDGHLGSMAVELGVMRNLVAVFTGMLMRTEAHTYVAPKMGAGQWRARVDLGWL